MNQRDRLAAAIRSAQSLPQSDQLDEYDLADALLFRGVRVVDVETLAVAVAEALIVLLDAPSASGGPADGTHHE